MALCISMLLTGIMCRRVDAAAQADMQEHLAQEVLRFHVLANSDSDADQALKLKVRDAVLAFLEETMPEMDNASQTAAWMREHIDAIEEVSPGDCGIRGRRVSCERSSYYLLVPGQDLR